jgi:DNA helicase-4
LALSQESAKQTKKSLYFRTKLSHVETALAEADACFNPEHGFFACHSLKQWMDKYAALKTALDDFEPQQTLLKTEEIDVIQNFRAFRMNAENLRSEYNQKFIREDLQQRTAIITDEDNNLIIAGAGSGKTTTIVGKVKYIIDRYKAKPEEILLISFTPMFFGNTLCR